MLLKGITYLALAAGGTALLATPAAPFSIAALAGGLLGSTAQNRFADLLKDHEDAVGRALFGRSPGIDENHHILLAVRDAHFAALRTVFSNYRSAAQADRVRQSEHSAFAIELGAYLKQNKRQRKEKSVAQPLETALFVGLKEGFDDALAMRGGTEPDDPKALQMLSEAILETLALETGFVPELFRASFVQDHEGYIDLFIRDAASRLKSNEAFRSIWLAEKVAGIAVTTGRVEAKLDALPEELEAVFGRVLRKSGLLDSAKAQNVQESTVIALARRIAPHVTDADQALRELRRAIEELLRIRAETARGSNIGDEVDEVFHRLEALNAEDRFDEGADEIDKALSACAERQRKEQAKQVRLLDLGFRQDLLRRNPGSAAERIVQMVELETADPKALFEALRGAQDEWYERGRDKGLNLDLEVAIEMAKLVALRASDTGERGTAQNDLGIALSILGERDSGTTHLEEAVTAYREALKERTRDRVPLQWAMTQNNLGNVLAALGARETGTTSLDEAVIAYREALKEYTRDRVPLQWATTQNNLGSALQTLGQRETGTARLDEAVTAYREALKEYTRDRVPLDWAMTQNNLGNALAALGARETGTTSLDEAVIAYREALKERTRDRVPLDWAMTQNNLGNALATLGERETGTTRLDEAVTAFREALKEYTRDRVPLQWAATQINLGNALRALGERETGTTNLDVAVTAYREALEEYTRDRVPLQWAMSWGNQGVAMSLLAERRADCNLARLAATQIEEARDVMREGGHAPFAAYYEHHLPLAQARVAQLCGQD